MLTIAWKVESKNKYKPYTYLENFKTVLTDIKEDLNKYRHIAFMHCRFSMVKISILPKLTYIFNEFSMKISIPFF